MKDLSEYTASNRAAWNASARAHQETAAWADLLDAAAKPDFCTFDHTLETTLRSLDIEGRRAVQIGCNNGRELLSLRALGAIPVLGLDQSEAFLDQARRLAAAAGSDASFVRADIYDLPDDLPRDFELGLITIGMLNWMPDIGRFFGIVAGLLAADAPLVIYETHPVLDMFDPDAADPLRPNRSYFARAPQVFNDVITYDGQDAGKAPESFWFSHTLGEIVTSCVRAGLTVELLEEYPHSNREVDYDIYEDQEIDIPMCYTLVVRKTG